MKPDQLLEEIKTKYSEWIEQAGDNAPALIIQILTVLLAKERDLTNYLKMRLDNVTANK